eukprot:Transcript_24636.p1 GENE.Transcript_24636~~Transcript_24636.p1  ORF type:complete len:413 (+),score=200.28 Transcript_24636:2120-3358(+)
MQLPAGPPRCYFEEARPLRLPPGPALDALNRCLHAFVHQTAHEAQQVDAPARLLIGGVQNEVTTLWPGAQVGCYGSRATGLACAASDVDLVVLGVPQPSEGLHRAMEWQLSALRALQERLARLPGVLTATIQKSAVPIIALTASAKVIAQLFENGEYAGDFKVEGSGELHLDISLHTAHHSGLLAAQHVRSLSLALPALQPLVLVLKEMLRRQRLKAAYTGGLSSYALTVMVAHFLVDGATGCPTPTARRRPPLVVAHQEDPSMPPAAPVEPPHSLASLLLACLHFFGQVFDAKQHAVCAGHGGPEDSAVGGFVMREPLKAFEMQPLVVYDPVCPTNNVAKGCYRIGQIQRVFSHAAAAAIDAANEAAAEAANAADAEAPADDAEALAKAADAAILEALLAPEAKGAAAKTK